MSKHASLGVMGLGTAVMVSIFLASVMMGLRGGVQASIQTIHVWHPGHLWCYMIRIKYYNFN